MSATKTDQPIRILHLSDFHFKASEKWDADPILRELASFIKREVQSGLAPDLVAITGDLAFSGKADEYALAQDWLENQLWPGVGDLPRDRLMLVPGNHDVDRSKVDFVAEAVQGRLLQKGLDPSRSQAQIAEVLDKPTQRDVVLKRHAAYLAFVEGWLGKPESLPWWQRVIEIRGTRMHVAGLDSAWMACGEDDRGRLLLGRYQLTQTVEVAAADGVHWRIAMAHHPWDYLAEFDSHPARALVHQHCDLLLRGHLHRPAPERVIPPDPSRACLELPTGCVYETSEYPNAFQWIELSPPPQKRVRVRFFTWNDGDWIVDRNRTGCVDGWWEVDLAASTLGGTDNGHPAAPLIPPAYLEWLERSCADVSLLGQGMQKGQAITLSHVYVPALLPGRVPLLARLDRESLYVPAPAGAGKSTFCRWAALQSIPSAELSHPVPAPIEFTEPTPVDLRRRLPLLVLLREFGRRMDCGRGERVWRQVDFERALATWIDAAPPPGLSGGLLQSHLHAGSAFLLFDGLDEVPPSEIRGDTTVYPRTLLVTGLGDALPAWRKAGNRILLTSRPYGLDWVGLHCLGLPIAPLEPLSQPLQDLFVSRWFQTLDKPEVIPELIATIRSRDDLAPLVENPMLLTALCVLYDNGGRLPEDRYDLYKSIVAGVLHNRYPGDASEREPVLRRLEAISLGMHEGEMDAPRAIPAPEISWVEIEQWLARFAELNPAYEKGSVGAAIQREDLLTRSGLLLPRPGERASFYHPTFQDFLSAQRIPRIRLDVGQVFQTRGTVPEWRSTLLFLFAAQVSNRDPEWGLALLDRLAAEQDRAAVKANPALAVFIAEALDLCLAKGYQLPATLAEAFRRITVSAIEDEISLLERHALALTLGRLGDPRIFDLRDARAYVEVPAGTYLYGENGERVEIETSFLLGRYQVTNSQYRAFMEDGGYAKREYWSEAGWAWRQTEGVTEPGTWRDRRWNGPNQPVVVVSFWEAEACCYWAGGRLPGEKEWKAANSDVYDGRNPWIEDRALRKYFISAGGQMLMTAPVGLFPGARGPRFGIMDHSGNGFEWCDGFYTGVCPSGPIGGPEWRPLGFGPCPIYSSPPFKYFRPNGLKAGSRMREVGFRCVLAPPRQP